MVEVSQCRVDRVAGLGILGVDVSGFGLQSGDRFRRSSSSIEFVYLLRGRGGHKLKTFKVCPKTADDIQAPCRSNRLVV